MGSKVAKEVAPAPVTHQSAPEPSEKIVFIGSYDSGADSLVNFLLINDDKDPNWISGQICAPTIRALTVRNWHANDMFNLHESLMDTRVVFCIPFGRRIDTTYLHDVVTKFNKIFKFAGRLDLIITGGPNIRDLRRGSEKIQLEGEIREYGRTAVFLFESWLPAVSCFYWWAGTSQVPKYPTWAREIVKSHLRQMIMMFLSTQKHTENL